MRPLLVRLLRWLAESLVRLYYPRRSLEGQEHLPAGGAALFVANHPNGLLDPLILRVTTGRPVRFLAKNTLWGNPFGRLAMDAFACLPVYRQQDLPAGADPGSAATARNRNEETFARCRAELRAGRSIALYPEGTSHSEPRLKPLKSGAARIALSAASEARAAGQAPAPMVPVGTYYEDKSIFRSGVHMVVGETIDLAPFIERFANGAAEPGGRDATAAVDVLTAEIRARLDQLVLQAETRELVDGIARVASWTARDPGDDAPDRRHARARDLLAAYGRLKAADPARLEQVTRAARRYARILDRLGVADPWQLESPRLGVGHVLASVARALLMAPAAVWGLLTSWIPYRLSGVVAGKMTRDEDVLSTFKMITGFFFLWFAWIIEAVVLGAFLGWPWAILSIVAAPPCGYAALRFGETLRETSEAVRHLGWRARSGMAERLAERRHRLAADVAAALREAQDVREEVEDPSPGEDASARAGAGRGVGAGTGAEPAS